MVVVVLRVGEIAENALLPKLFGVLIHLHEGIVFKKIVDFAGLFDGFDKLDAFTGREERRDFAHDMFACVQCLDAVFCVGGEPRGDEHGVDVGREKFIFIVRHESVRKVFLETLAHVKIVVATSDDIDV